ncbi:Autophagy-related protein 27 domain containing protein [Elaphomyces granulatus]
MRILSQAAIFILPSLLPSLAAGSGFDCKHIVVDGIKFDLSRLGGVHELYHVETNEDAVVNTTHATARDEKESESYAFPIAGLDPLGHGSKDPEITRLKKLDAERQGLLVKLSGGEYLEDHEKKKKDTAALIEFQCDPDKSGLEGLEDSETSDAAANRRRSQLEATSDDNTGDDKDGDDKDGDDHDDGSNPSRSLQFKSFKLVDDTYILRLDWKTRYACDDYLKNRKDDSPSGHWGFFTWLIIILFLCTAAYLIFGSWLNYNRYGARGWDLLPHGDTIRDIPYIFQDWIRRVINTVQGPGSRGGYSAV